MTKYEVWDIEESDGEDFSEVSVETGLHSAENAAIEYINRFDSEWQCRYIDDPPTLAVRIPGETAFELFETTVEPVLDIRAYPFEEETE